eukprot:361354-Chlamydomonas_euryale.AAC.4
MLRRDPISSRSASTLRALRRLGIRCVGHALTGLLQPGRTHTQPGLSSEDFIYRVLAHYRASEDAGTATMASSSAVVSILEKVRAGADAQIACTRGL